MKSSDMRIKRIFVEIYKQIFIICNVYDESESNKYFTFY